MKKILLLIFALLLAPFLVSAVEIVDFYWTNSQINTLEINYGESAQFEAYVADYYSGFSVNIFLEDISTGEITQIINQRYPAREEAEIIFSLNQGHYGEAGSYILHITAQNLDNDRESRELYLNINEVQENHAPTIQLRSPLDDARDVIINPTLTWQGSDEDEDDELTYDVYLDNNLIADNIITMQYQLQNLNYNTNYEWYIIVSDGQSETRSEAWSFRTIQNPEENHAPNVPSNPYPAHNSINIPIELTLTWLGGDPNNDVVRYDVYLNNRLVCDNTILTSCRVENLRYNTIYSWYVIASDGQLTSQGQLWGFTTQAIIENQAPTINIRAPEENGIISGVYNIRWNANDVDGEIINTKIYYKPYSRIPLVKYLFNWLYEYELLADLNDNPGNYFWDTTRLRNRIYSLKIVVADDDNANGEDVVNRFRIFNREIQNHAPIIISEPVTNIKVNNQYIYDVNAVDADGDEITYSLRNAPRGMRINPNTGFISWLPDTIGIYTDITVTATDEHGAFDPQTFTIKVLSKDIVVAPKKEPRDIHEFSLSNVILYQDNYYIDVYVQVMNKGNQNEKIVLKAINMNTGDFMFDSFLLENKDNYWRILKLHKPKKGIYTIGVFGNSKDYKDIVYREIVIR